MKYRNLVFEGGGVKGIAYVGALEHLTSTPLKKNDKPIDLKEIERVAGTSAGAIAALLVSLNYSVAEIRKKFEELDFRDFADKVNIFEWAYSRFIKGEHYLYKGEKVLEWIRERIKEKFGQESITFQELQDKGGKSLYVIGTNLSRQRIDVFSQEHTPDMPIDIAVRASMAIPFAFKGVSFSIENGRYNPEGTELYVDGGVMCNYPVEIFDNVDYIMDAEYRKRVTFESLCSLLTAPMFLRTSTAKAFVKPKPTEPGLYRFVNAETLGLKVDSKEEIKLYSDNVAKEINESTCKEEASRQQISSLFDYTKSLISIFYNSQDLIRGKTENLRTIYIDAKEISTTDFSLTEAKKIALIESGKKSCEDFAVTYSIKMQERQKINKVKAEELDDDSVEHYFSEVRETLRMLRAEPLFFRAECKDESKQFFGIKRKSEADAAMDLPEHTDHKNKKVRPCSPPTP